MHDSENILTIAMSMLSIIGLLLLVLNILLDFYENK